MPLISYDANLDMVRIDGFHKGAIEIYTKHTMAEVAPSWPVGLRVLPLKPRFWAYYVRWTSEEAGRWTERTVGVLNLAFPYVDAIFRTIKEKAPSFHQGPRGVRYSAR